MFNFNRQFEIHDDVEVLRRMGMTYGLEHDQCTEDVFQSVLSMLPTSVHHIFTGNTDISVRD